MFNVFTLGRPMFWLGYKLRRRFEAHVSNSDMLRGVRAFLKLPADTTACRLERWTRSDAKQERKTVAPLYAPADERFPILRASLPLRCLCRVGSCPALVHPRTGVLFGIRITPYLCLLRLPDAARNEALHCGAAWSRNPLPALRDIDLAATFGPDWVVPNTLHSSFRCFYLAAFEFAANSPPA